MYTHEEYINSKTIDTQYMHLRLNRSIELEDSITDAYFSSSFTPIPSTRREMTEPGRRYLTTTTSSSNQRSPHLSQRLRAKTSWSHDGLMMDIKLFTEDYSFGAPRRYPAPYCTEISQHTQVLYHITDSRYISNDSGRAWQSAHSQGASGMMMAATRSRAHAMAASSLKATGDTGGAGAIWR